VFANGRFQMTDQLIKMKKWLEREKKSSEIK
jgi:hypothetical protein